MTEQKPSFIQRVAKEVFGIGSQPNKELVAATKKEQELRAFALESALVGTLCTLEPGRAVAPVEREVLHVLMGYRETYGVELSLRVGGTPREGVLSRLVPEQLEKSGEYDLHLTELEASYAFIPMESVFCYLDEQLIPTSLFVGYWCREDGNRQANIVLLEQLPTEDTMDALKKEIQEKCIDTTLDKRTVRLARSGSSFSVGFPSEGNFEQFELWKRVEILGRQLFVFISLVQEHKNKPKMGDEKKTKKKEPFRLPLLAPASPALQT